MGSETKAEVRIYITVLKDGMVLSRKQSLPKPVFLSLYPARWKDSKRTKREAGVQPEAQPGAATLGLVTFGTLSLVTTKLHLWKCEKKLPPP